MLTELSLSPLATADTTRLAEAVAGRALQPVEANLLQATTGGFPLYIIEAIRTLAAPDSVLLPGRDLQAVLRMRFQVDRAYGSLAAYVAEHALGVEGPLREFDVVASHETADETLWRTEIGWPIFPTGPGPSSAARDPAGPS